MKKIGIKIDIDSIDLETARYFAEKRNSNMGQSHSIVAKEFDISCHIAGCIGEIAARKYLNIALDLPVDTFKNAPDILYNDNWIEVKSSKTGWFNCKLSERIDQTVLLVSNFTKQNYCLILCELSMEQFKRITMQHGTPNYWSGSTEICGYRIKYQDLKYYAALDTV
jgi:hypothetical protein